MQPRSEPHRLETLAAPIQEPSQRLGESDGIRRRRDGFDRSHHRQAGVDALGLPELLISFVARALQGYNCKRCKITSKSGVFRTKSGKAGNLPYKMTESCNSGLVIFG